MTTPQTYALFAMLTCAIILIGVSYCAGLKTGDRAAKDISANYSQLFDALREGHAQAISDQAVKLASALQALDMREHELAAARKNIKDEFDDHTRVEQLLLSQLETAKAKGLTQDDYLTLKLAAKQLGTASVQFIKSGSNKINQAWLAQTRLNEVADRLHAALSTEPLPCKTVSNAVELITDTDLVEWLCREAVFFNAAPGEVGFCFDLAEPAHHLDGVEHARDVLRAAYEQQQKRDLEYGLALGAAA